MIQLERLEKVILIFLVLALVLGITISYCQKNRLPASVTIEKFNTEEYKAASREESYSSVEKIDLNNASAEDLMKIRGIGEAIAGRIVEYRNKNGGFASIDDIKNVKGVGVALFEKIKTRIKVDDR